MLAKPLRGFVMRLQTHKSVASTRAGSRRLLGPTPSSPRHLVCVYAKGNAVMVVESPTKASKIQKFLGDKYTVLSSYGHVRDLPSKPGSVKPEEDFRMLWDYLPRAYPRYKEIEDAARRADRILLATDPDREGEAISWHLAQELERRGLLKGRNLQRVTFTEITQAAVEQALKAPREVSAQLVDAYLARRALDYLMGFNISPLLWRKLQGATSAGRVQSVALRLCCEREVESCKFVPEEYWSIIVQLGLPGGKAINAVLSRADGNKMGGMAIKDRAQAEALAARIKGTRFQVSDVQSKLQQRQPAAPFITSTLQQEASRRLGFGASRTMSAAQALYEGSEAGEGLITYMRTDGVQLSPDAIKAVRNTVSSRYGPDLVSEQPRVYKSRAKNAQEAHEAIRPTNPNLEPGNLPSNMRATDLSRLYQLIWERTLASQMRNAVIEQVGADFTSMDGSLVLRATGSRVQQPGYLTVYDNYRRTAEDQDEPNNDSEGDHAENNGPAAAGMLSLLKAKQDVSMQGVSPLQHFTRPPPRYTEATLIKALEELGIGRPSTYAPTLRVLQTRGYINKEGRSLVPSSKGLVLTAFLQRYFQRYIDYSFTSQMEEQLDEVSDGSLPWKEVLREFWGPFYGACEGLKDLKVSEVVDVLDKELEPIFFPDSNEEDVRKCPVCSTGRLHFKPSKLGGFVGCSNFDHPQAPCSYARPLHVPGSSASEEALEEAMMSEPLHLGDHPETQQPVWRKKGPYGMYVEMAPSQRDEDAANDQIRKGTKGKKRKSGPAARASIPKDVDAQSITLEDAIQLLEATIPQSLGSHPEDGAPIFVKSGRFGPYVEHQEVRAPIPKDKSPESISLEEALELISKKSERMAKRGILPRALKSSGKSNQASSSSSSRSKGKSTSTSSTGTSTSSNGNGTSSSSEAKSQKPRRLSGYTLFCSEQRQAVASANPGARPKDIMKLMAAAWHAQGDAGKANYNARAAAADTSASSNGGGSATTTTNNNNNGNNNNGTGTASPAGPKASTLGGGNSTGESNGDDKNASSNGAPKRAGRPRKARVVPKAKA